jgi:hypothetical protein
MHRPPLAAFFVLCTSAWVALTVGASQTVAQAPSEEQLEDAGTSIAVPNEAPVADASMGSSFDPVPESLREYVIAAASTTGHWNGEGHCRYERLDD